MFLYILFIIWCLLVWVDICWYVINLCKIIKIKVKDIVDFVDMINIFLVFFFNVGFLVEFLFFFVCLWVGVFNLKKNKMNCVIKINFYSK